jgi:hypothetical protein
VLYDKLWQSPDTQLARKYGILDIGATRVEFLEVGASFRIAVNRVELCRCARSVGVPSQQGEGKCRVSVLSGRKPSSIFRNPFTATDAKADDIALDDDATTCWTRRCGRSSKPWRAGAFCPPGPLRLARI